MEWHCFQKSLLYIYNYKSKKKFALYSHQYLFIITAFAPFWTSAGVGIRWSQRSLPTQGTLIFNVWHIFSVHYLFHIFPPKDVFIDDVSEESTRYINVSKWSCKIAVYHCWQRRSSSFPLLLIFQTHGWYWLAQRHGWLSWRKVRSCSVRLSMKKAEGEHYLLLSQHQNGRLAHPTLWNCVLWIQIFLLCCFFLEHCCKLGGRSFPRLCWSVQG